MQQRYYILGMTCENCRKSVHEKINSLKKVNSVSVFLDKEEALVQLETHIEVLGIKQILGSKHTVQEVPIKSSLAQSQSQSKWKSLFPLFLIFGYLISGTTFFK
jgi:copper chaperone CopZ